VRHHDGDPAGTRFLQFGEDLALGLGIDRTGRLVKDPDRCITQADPCQSEPLPWAVGQTDTAPLLTQLTRSSILAALSAARADHH
jgi:hypothetical protein